MDDQKRYMTDEERLLLEGKGFNPDKLLKEGFFEKDTIRPKEMTFQDLLDLEEEGFNAFAPDQSPENMLKNMNLVMTQLYSEEELEQIRKLPAKGLMKLFSDINEITFGTGSEEIKN